MNDTRQHEIVQLIFIFFLLFNGKYFYGTRKIYIRLICIVGLRRIWQCRVLIFFIV